MESKETTRGAILFDKGEVIPSAEIHERAEPALEESEGVGHDERLEILPPMKDNQHHGTFILHNFEDLFLHNEFAQDYSVQHFLDWNSRMSSFEERD